MDWQYTYDQAGNRWSDYTSKVPGGITSVGYSISSVDQIYNSNSSAYPANPDTTYTWDDNGNMDIAQINLGGIILTGNYTWDAKNQLTSVSFPGYSSSEFTYDGLGRRVEITEKNSVGATTAHRYFVWEGMRLAEERSYTSGAPIKKFYPQGEVRGSAKYYYTKDHLGSTREVLDGNNNIIARYDYDPFGQPTQTVGTMQFDRLFTGHFYHSPSGLYLAPYRAYNPALGRWISRDPLGEAGGLNLYGYVGNDPLTRTDPTGLFWYPEFWQPLANFLEDNFLKRTYKRLTCPAPGSAARGAEFAADVQANMYGIASASMAPGLLVAGSSGNQVVQRWMSRAELEATQSSGLLRGGREGIHYVTDSANSSAKRARIRLALDYTPEVKVKLEVPQGTFSDPTRITPANGMLGGGLERTATGNVPVKIISIGGKP